MPILNSLIRRKTTPETPWMHGDACIFLAGLPAAFDEVARTPVGHEDALEAKASNRGVIYPQWRMVWAEHS
nr:unnamed protein product [Spirometra erinaceieuropaei]